MSLATLSSGLDELEQLLADENWDGLSNRYSAWQKEFNLQTTFETTPEALDAFAKLIERHDAILRALGVFQKQLLHSRSQLQKQRRALNAYLG